MKYYPIYLDIKGKNCLIVGGGPVGIRKAATLERCGAKVRIISETFLTGIDELKKTGICFVKKKYEKQEMKGMFLVFAATNNADLNQEIKKDALELGILCNIADSLDNSDFLLPSTVERGNLVIAVSTSGSSPAMAKKIRQDLGFQFGPEYATFLQLMENIRKRFLLSDNDPDENKKIFYDLIDKGLLEFIKAKDEKSINRVLREVLGKGFLYQDLVFLRSDE